MKFKKWHGLMLVSAVILALLAYGLSLHQQLPAVEPVADSKEELKFTLIVSGKVELAPGIEISSQINGNVAEVMVVAGEAISAGQALFTLQSKTDYAALQKARAETMQADARFRKISEQTQAGSALSMKRAQAALDSAKKHYAKSSELAAKGMISQQHAADALHNLTIAQNQLSTTKFQAQALRAKGSDYALAEAALNKARAAEQALRASARQQTILAERAGSVTACKVARGDAVVPGKMLALIAPAEALRVQAQIDAQYLPALKPGQRATVAVAGQAGHYAAVLTSIKPATDKTPAQAEFKFDANSPPVDLAADTVLSLEMELLSPATVRSTTVTEIKEKSPLQTDQAG